tara:strand:- start:64 stop:765 length:702 start_codon:yes stop_codon:yes gene_type:complete
MKQLDNICVIIQARLGSQRIPQKMIKPFAGTTLFDLSIRKVLDSSFIPEKNFYVSVYEQELIDIANNHGANIFLRSEKSATSEGTPMTDMYEWWDKLPFEYCVLVNGCTPFLETETIDGFVKAYMETDSDGLFGVMEKKNYFWNKDGVLQTPWPESEACMNTKVVETTYEAAHCLYAGRMNTIKDGIWMGDFQTPGEIQLYPMEERECLDIDYPWQFELCETLYLESLRKETK